MGWRVGCMDVDWWSRYGKLFTAYVVFVKGVGLIYDNYCTILFLFLYSQILILTFYKYIGTTKLTQTLFYFILFFILN